MSSIARVTEVYPRTDPAGMPMGLRVDRQVVALRLGAPEAGPDLGQQARGVFRAMRELVERAGGAPENIAKATAYVSSAAEREPVNGTWREEVFQDPADRPAYKVLVAPLPAGRLVELDVLAILGATRRRIDVPGVPARDPTVEIGGMIFTSRVHGTVPFSGDQVAEGGARGQARQAFRNVLELATLAGGGPGDIIQLKTFSRDPACADPIRQAFAEMFPGEAARPQLVTLTNYVPAKFEVMVEMTAVIGATEAIERKDS
jgi:enamine deaminase RidA (YjgF/YER057c/UK114 family)